MKSFWTGSEDPQTLELEPKISKVRRATPPAPVAQPPTYICALAAALCPLCTFAHAIVQRTKPGESAPLTSRVQPNRVLNELAMLTLVNGHENVVSLVGGFWLGGGEAHRRQSHQFVL